ncbi:MAG: hypothetical protein ACPHLL_03500 [Porticoccaceae bacterium]
MSNISHKINGRWTQRFLSFVDYIDRPWVVILMGILNIFPFVLFLYFTREPVAAIVNQSLSVTFVHWLATYSLWLFLGTILFLSLYNFLPKIANAIAKKSGILKLEDALILKEAFEDIVGIKSDRIGGECEAFLNKGDSSDPDQVFKSIAQPDQQIYFTVNTIWKFLEKISGNLGFDVRLAEIGPLGELVGWYTHGGEPPKHDISELDCADSALRYCVSKKSVVVIPDIQKEAEKTVDQHYHMFEEHEKGSLLCYPIYHKPTKSYPYVLFIKTNKAGYFTAGREEYYKWLYDQFGLRLGLEHSLRLLKGD